MGRLERQLKKTNPYVAVPSTRDQEKAARRQEKAERKAAARRSGHLASVNGGKPKGWRFW